MLPMRLPAVATLAALMTFSSSIFAAAQTSDPVPPAGEMPDQNQGAQADRPDMMRGDKMRGDRMRHRDRMRGMPMHRQMMKIMFAIVDADNDGGLSFEEISTIHRRIFNKVDTDKDGKVTPEEMQTFMRE